MVVYNYGKNGEKQWVETTPTKSTKPTKPTFVSNGEKIMKFKKKKKKEENPDRIDIEYETSNRIQLPSKDMAINHTRIKINAKDYDTAMSAIDRFLPTKKEQMDAINLNKKKAKNGK